MIQFVNVGGPSATAKALVVMATMHPRVYGKGIIFIYQINSAVKLTSVGLAHIHPNYILIPSYLEL